MLVLPGVCGAGTAEAADRARIALGAVRVHGRPLECSAGVANCPDDAAEATELLERADAALYAAKHAGRRQTRRYAANLSSRPSVDDERREIEALLRSPGSIRPVFQPLLELATGRVGGYEALARIPGDRTPDQWFAQAHRVGLGPELEAAALHAALGVRGRPAGTFLAVNVSPVALLTEAVHAELPEDLGALASFAADTGAAVCGEGIEDLADLQALAELDATYAQGFALARPAAAWPSLLPGAAAATSARVVHGIRLAADAPFGAAAWTRGLASLADDLSRVRGIDEFVVAGRRAARLLDADDASLMRVVDGALEQVTDEDQTFGRRWDLDTFPATRRLLGERTPGQVVVGDPESDPDEVAELERARVVALQFAAVLGRLYR